MMSHEVNNSIGAISATLSVISEIIRQDQNNEWDDLLQAVDASRNRCGHLTHFIGNLGSLVKIPKPQYSTINLNELARTVDAIIRVKCRQRNIILTSQLSPDNPVVSVDGIQFEQVLVNILKNAYEAIGENGEIHIITQSEPLSIAIEDNGTGISDNVKQKLFTPFFSTKNEGQGIGLMFIREVLTSHNCKFELTSENGWTRFVITF
jgi:signal transduction histidine kinase